VTEPRAQGPRLIGTDAVAHVARLARLSLTQAEIERFSEQLSSVLEFATALDQLDVGELPPMAHPLPLSNVLRPDEPEPCLPRDIVLAGAPEAEADRFRVPRILGEEA
jgi:aspartyl-tRNA(Asn)/glutamyl-tRNA(Gln) amidotransferase subunit C